MRTYLFVDAENHFLRSAKAAEDVIGSSGAARAMSSVEVSPHGLPGFPRKFGGRRFEWDPGLQLFWDCKLLSQGGVSMPSGAHIARAIYVCSCTGNDDKAHEMRVRLREFGFEPIVLKEPKDLEKQREGQREAHGLIEKPKGCDIALATRMVADAAADLYDCCLLFTSDADFLPAIEAVRRMGKVVWVFGHKSGLSARSPYLHVPDRFIDLRGYIESAWAEHRGTIEAALTAIDRPDPLHGSQP